MEDNEACIAGLTLGLGIGGGGGGYVPKQKKVNNNSVPSLDLNFDEVYPKREDQKVIDEDVNTNNNNHHHHHHHHVADEGLCLKRRTTDEGHNHQKTIEKSNDDSNNSDKNNSRKKLRLTKEQSAMLEESFKLHTTLNQAQKQALAEQLNLKHRQVEVWFQNRRARTKLKQTEVDCEFLKKCCEKLTDENIRLKKELQNLRALKIEPSLYIQLSKAATLTLCSSCEEQVMKPNNNTNEEKVEDAVISDVVQNNNHNMESSIEN